MLNKRRERGRERERERERKREREREREEREKEDRRKLCAKAHEMNEVRRIKRPLKQDTSYGSTEATADGLVDRLPNLPQGQFGVAQKHYC